MTGSRTTGEQDLRSALRRFEQAGVLQHVTAPVDLDYEVAAVLWRLRHGPTVVFDNVQGSDVPIVGNVLNSRDKLAIALGLPRQDLLDRLTTAARETIPTNEVGDAPCQERSIAADVDVLDLLPIPLISEHDGGRYISAGLMIARDPTTGRRNVAICRVQPRPGNRLGCYLAPTHTYQFLQQCKELGRPLEVAVVIGVHPALMAASQLLVPGDELEHAGAIFGAPVDVAACRTVDLDVPAGAEIVIEGRIDPTVTEEEGPFGEFPGTYAPARMNPVIEVTHVSTRHAPMFQMIVGGRHPEHLITGAVAREATLLTAVRAVVPGAREVLLPEGGVCRFHAVISIRKRVEGEGKLAIMAALTNQDLLKHVVVVDDDIDVSDPVQVEWAVATRMRAHEDLVMIQGCKSNPVDPMSQDRTITKLGVDATLPLTSDLRGMPAPDVPADVRTRIDDRWDELMGQ